MPEATLFDDELKVASLSALRQAVDACRRCPLYKNATHGVPGEGARHASLMLIGEQPGDKEDLAGRPFVGPAGRMLDKALADAGVDRGQAFVTNAVKHFKFVMRGKRRLHKRPSVYEIDRCRWWQEQERTIVRPAVIVAMGATAARSLFGKPMTIGTNRGQRFDLEDGAAAFITIHPSALLRMTTDAEKEREYQAFVADLKKVQAFLRRHAA